MSKNKSSDVLYEDIYDFDDINDDSFHSSRSFDSFTISKHGHIVSRDPSVNRPKVKADVSRLPRTENPVRLPAVATNKKTNTKRQQRSLAELGHMDMKKEQKHDKVLSRLRQNHSSELKDISRKRTSRLNTHYEYHTKPVNDDVLYRSLMAGLTDKSVIGGSSQVLEYERRSRRNHEVSTFQPAPPTTPKLATSHSGNTTSRRRLFRANQQLEQDVSCHNPPKQYFNPPLPQPEVEIDFERDITEALRVEKELYAFHRELNKENKYHIQVGTEVHLPTLTEVSPNTSLRPKQSSPYGISAVRAPCKTAESKAIVKKPKEKSIIDVNRLPDKIRREMKKYFN